MKTESTMKVMSKNMCLVCKGGRMLCGQRYCPLLKQVRLKKPTEKKLSDLMYGLSPSIFVGHRTYPNVYVGPMTSLWEKKADLLDDPRRWYGLGFNDIVEMRSQLVRSKQKHAVDGRNRFIEEAQELALSKKPVYVENQFKKRPSFNVTFSSRMQPMGPTGELRKMLIAENPRIPRKVDSLVDDEVKSQHAVYELYENNYDVYYLSKALSSGALGLEDNKHLVPTRWSITAVDDMLSKRMMKSIREYPEINNYLVYGNEYLDNHFEILLIPGKWEFEQFEAWAPKTVWTKGVSEPVIVAEHEPFSGRTTYAKSQAGGYYAARFSVTEHLYKIGRQARALVFREVSEGYVMPVGVWEVRENIRKAFEKRPEKFNELSKALDFIDTRLSIPMKQYKKRSELLRQRKLTDFLC